MKKLLFLMAAIGSLTVTAQTDPEHQQFQHIDVFQRHNLKYGVLERYVNTSTCHESAQALMACVKVINTLLTLADSELNGTNLVLKDPTKILVLNNTLKDIKKKKKQYPFGDATVIPYSKELKRLTLDTPDQLLEVAFANALKDGDVVKVEPALRFALDAIIHRNEALDANRSFVVMFTMNSMLEIVDPHSYILDGTHSEKVSHRDDNNQVGIGVMIENHKDGALVMEILEDSAASEVDIQVGDILTGASQINEKGVVQDFVSFAGKKLEAIVPMLKGENKTKLKITLSRSAVDKTTSNLELEMTRKPYKLENVVIKVEPFQGKNIAYVKIREFREGTAKDVRTELFKIVFKENEKIDAVTLDLRGNPGGLINEATDLLGTWIHGGIEVASTKNYQEFPEVIVDILFNFARQKPETKMFSFNKVSDLVKKYYNPNATDLIQTLPQTDSQKFYSRFNFGDKINAFFKDVPLVVLVNNYSASASELTSNSLQDLSRSLTIGTQTFGKGVGQPHLPLFGTEKNSLQFQFTIFEFLAPSGRSMHLDGVTPDVVVYRNKTPTEEELKPARTERGNYWFASSRKVKTSPKWNYKVKDNYAEKVSFVENCVAKDGHTEKKYNDDTAMRKGDYQLAYAYGSSVCLNKYNDMKALAAAPVEAPAVEPKPAEAPLSKPPETQKQRRPRTPQVPPAS